MSTATRRHHVVHRHQPVEPCAHGFTLYLRNHKRTTRVEITRKQAAALADRLARALARRNPERFEIDEDRWLDPEIM
ncbi:MAG TPA: hypothetical protein VL382_08445 [Terriglobales bacterium]|nr:hypothetical protein [Terriglobales bacterium]